MRYADTTSRRRAGFTLVELVIVIAIITVLIAMLTAGVMATWKTGTLARLRADFSQIDRAIGEARVAFNGVSYLPSRLVLYKSVSSYSSAKPGSVEAESYVFLQKMFGPNVGRGVTINWDGGKGATDPVDLMADQVLVFYLGGIPDPTENRCQGFSDDPNNPSSAGGNRKGPFFSFDPRRLARRANGFFTYGDTLTGAPYLYFSPRKTPNSYQSGDTGGYVGTSTTPYYSQAAGASQPTYMNPDSYQILCAGLDGTFGVGGKFDPAVGVTDTNGLDDLSNFSLQELGKPVN